MNRRGAIAVYAVVCVVITACGGNGAELEQMLGRSQQQAARPSALQVSRPLALNDASLAAGETLTGMVTWTNKSGKAAPMARVWITTVPPGGDLTTGPFHDLAPDIVSIMVPSRQTVELVASRVIAAGDAP